MIGSVTRLGDRLLESPRGGGGRPLGMHELVTVDETHKGKRISGIQSVLALATVDRMAVMRPRPGAASSPLPPSDSVPRDGGYD